jgi:hypothetical protein
MGGRTTHGLPFAAKDQTRLEDHQSSTGIRGVRSFVLNGGKMAHQAGLEPRAIGRLIVSLQFSALAVLFLLARLGWENGGGSFSIIH